MARLEMLYLQQTQITSLPTHIGRLQNLEYLAIGTTKTLLQLARDRRPDKLILVMRETIRYQKNYRKRSEISPI